MKPYFSIILPIYNVGKYLERCIQSVLLQDFRDYEMILVDDGSTDESAELCDRYEEKYEFIHTIHKENGGLSSARNAGMELASGQYIWWVDSDDWIEEGALKALDAVCRNEQPDIVKFNYYRQTNEKCQVITNLAPGRYEEGAIKSTVLDKAFCSAGKFTLSAWSHVYRREFLLEHKLVFVSERTIGSEDYLFNLCAYLQAEKLVALGQILYGYEQRMQSLSQGYRENLPERYNVLYGMVRKYYQKAGVLEKYEKKICYFYVWHLLRGTCLSNEYVGDSKLTQKERRERVWKYLQHQDTKEAAEKCRDMMKGLKARVMLWAMSRAFEPGVYWICCVWPKVKRRMKK